MSIRHLNELETRLSIAHWQIVERVDRTDFAELCFWVVARPDGTSKFKIQFEADPERDAQTVLDSFAVRAELEGFPSLYFARGSSWAEELSTFVNKISAVNRP